MLVGSYGLQSAPPRVQDCIRVKNIDSGKVHECVSMIRGSLANTIGTRKNRSATGRTCSALVVSSRSKFWYHMELVWELAMKAVYNLVNQQVRHQMVCYDTFAAIDLTKEWQSH